MSVDVSQYKVGVIQSLEECGSSRGQTLKACKIKISEDDIICVVTSAPNVREGSRVVVAPAGSEVLGKDGEMMPVTKATVGGVQSEGMLCDSRMLNWSGGAEGIAVNLPDDFEIGSCPPSSKPRPKGLDQESSIPSGPVEPGLFEKKLSKEEKKKLAAERKAKRAAAKEKKLAES